MTAEPGGFTPRRCDSRHKETSVLSCTDHPRAAPYFVMSIFPIATFEYDFTPIAFLQRFAECFEV